MNYMASDNKLRAKKICQAKAYQQIEIVVIAGKGAFSSLGLAKINTWRTVAQHKGVVEDFHFTHNLSTQPASLL